MRLTLVLHVVAGALGLLSGFAALYAPKGARLHRKSGVIFVATMLTMAAAGFTVAIVRGVAPDINVPAALLTSYLVVTAFTTVRPVVTGARSLHVGGMVLALGTTLTMLVFGIEAVANGGVRNGMPAFPFFMFALIGLLGSLGDGRMMRTGPLRGTKRLARHLWRMCTALFIAALSFFIGQADVIPQPYRIRPLLALPVLAVLVTMFYWLWRVRIRRSLRGIVGVNAPEAI
jgi:uncharacterized membrane protein